MSLFLILAWLGLTTGLLVASWSASASKRVAGLRLNAIRLAGLAVVVRLVPALLLQLPRDSLVQWDIDSYHIAAGLLLAGRDIYRSGRYPYLPLQIYPLAAAQWLNLHTGTPFLLLIKAPLILADAGTVVLLWRAALRRGQEAGAASRVVLLFVLNPLSIVVTSLHGQFDAIPLFFTLAAWSLLDKRSNLRANSVAVLGAGLLLGSGIAGKSWPALLAPALLWMLPDWKSRTALLGAAAVPILGSLALYGLLLGVRPWQPLGSALGYRAFTGVWGVSLLATKLQSIWPGIAPFARFLDGHGGAVDLAAVFAAGFWLRRSRDSVRNCLVLLLVAFATASGWGYHWLIWPLPFAALTSEGWTRRYTVVCALEYVAIYFFFGGIAWGFTRFTDSLAILNDTWLLSLPVWFFICTWALRELSASVGPRPSPARPDASGHDLSLSLRED